MKKILPLLILFTLACSKPKPPAIRVAMLTNSIKVTGLDYAIASEINRDSVPEAWESLMPVYRMPADTELKDYQPTQPGVYKLQDSVIVFTPDTPFVKGQTYFLRYYQFAGTDIWDYVRGKRKLRSIPYTDFVLKK
jgi:hypothetical protein